MSRIFADGLLESRICIVTGAGTGLGRAAALELADLGATLVLVGRRPEPLQETADMIGDRAEMHSLDIRDEEAVEAMVDAVLERHGRIDVLVNNAGGQYMAPAEAVTGKGFRTVLELNASGTWNMTRAVATKAMIPSGTGGRIINVTLTPHQGFPGMFHTGAARAAVENMTRGLAVEWARFGINVTAIAAGHFDTEVMHTKYPEAARRMAAKMPPAQRLGRPEEFAWMVAYLASPAGDYITGTVLSVDGARDNFLGPWPPPGIYDGGQSPTEERRAKE